MRNILLGACILIVCGCSQEKPYDPQKELVEFLKGEAAARSQELADIKVKSANKADMDGLKVAVQELGLKIIELKAEAVLPVKEMQRQKDELAEEKKAWKKELEESRQELKDEFRELLETRKALLSASVRPKTRYESLHEELDNLRVRRDQLHVDFTKADPKDRPEIANAETNVRKLIRELEAEIEMVIKK